MRPVTRGTRASRECTSATTSTTRNACFDPLRRGPDGLERVSWEGATREIGAKLRSLRDRHGPGSIATLLGNAADSAAIALANTLCHAFGSANSFNVLSLVHRHGVRWPNGCSGTRTSLSSGTWTGRASRFCSAADPLGHNGMTSLQRRPPPSLPILKAHPARRREGRRALHRDGEGRGRGLHRHPLGHRSFPARRDDSPNPATGNTTTLSWSATQRVTSSGAASPNGSIPLVRRRSAGVRSARSSSSPTSSPQPTGRSRRPRVGVRPAHNTTLTEWAIVVLPSPETSTARDVSSTPGHRRARPCSSVFSKRRDRVPNWRLSADLRRSSCAGLRR